LNDTFDDVLDSAFVDEDLIAVRSFKSLGVFFIALGDIHLCFLIMYSSVKTEFDEICFWTDVKWSGRMEA